MGTFFSFLLFLKYKVMIEKFLNLIYINVFYDLIY